MGKRLHAYSIGAAIASAVFGGLWAMDIRSEVDGDPHKPRPRSKGEKARNRKYRG